MNKPSGIVTFLFTDIEGSTKLAQDNPLLIQHLLKLHNSIIQNAVDSNGGFVFKIIGDAFCCSFGNAADAVNAAFTSQMNISNEVWGEAEIKVRMGIHSGYAEWNGSDYMGYLTLARTQRIMSVAYGGQILISNDSYELIKKCESEDKKYRDLGERKLKDLIYPVKLYQLISENLRSEFPPLKTLDARPNNLPVQLTSFIGREQEILILKNIISEGRLLTLIGSGGTGKTRLALQTGADLIDEFTNGVWLVELASINNSILIPQAIMQSMKLKEEPGINPEETILNFLKDKEILIILDNCEHLINGSSEITDKLLKNCPLLKVLTTSREPLKIRGEQIHKVTSLALPDLNDNILPERLIQFEAVRLFIERALLIKPEFRVNKDNAHALAQICTQLDGIPLAIELAAARIKVLSLDKINDRLSDRFRLLTGGNRNDLPRQQTLRALIDWSYELLSEEEKLLWKRLSVFNGGFEMEAAGNICSDDLIKEEDILDLLNNLTEKSILIFDSSKERFKMLETIREYGKELFKNQEEKNTLYVKHLNYFLHFAEFMNPELVGSAILQNLQKIEPENGNFETALAYSLENGFLEEGARLAISLSRFWKLRGYNLSGYKWFEKFCNSSNEISKKTYSVVLNWAAEFKSNMGEYECAYNLFEKSLAVSRELNDKSWISSSLNSLGAIAARKGNYEHARNFISKSIIYRRESGEMLKLCGALNNLGQLEILLSNFDEADMHIKESLKLSYEAEDNYYIYLSLRNAGQLASIRNNYHMAEEYLKKALNVNREMKFKSGISSSLTELSEVCILQGKIEEAKTYINESLKLAIELEEKIYEAMVFGVMGLLEIKLNNFEKAKSLYQRSLELYQFIEDINGTAISLCGIGDAEYGLKRFSESFKQYKESLKLFSEMGNKREASNCLLKISEFAVLKNNGAGYLSYDVFARLFAAADNIRISLGLMPSENDKLKNYRIYEILKNNLDKQTLIELTEEGKSMPLHKAVDLIMNNSDVN